MPPALRAAFWMTGAIASFSAMAVAGRFAALDHDVFEILLYRSLIGIAIVVTIASIAGTRGQITGNHLPLHLVRNVAHFAGQALWFFALTTVPLATVFALEFTSPVWATLLAPLVLGERLTARQLLAVAIGFAGVLIVVQPGATPLSWGVAAAALAALGFGSTALFTRRLTRHASTTCILFWLTCIQTVIALIAAGADGDIALPIAAAMPWIALIALAGLGAHFCLTTALALAPAAVVMPVDFARLPLIAVIGALFYDEPVGVALIIGAGLIIGANWINLSGESPRKG